MTKFDLPHKHNETEDALMLYEELSRVDYFEAVAEVFKQLGDTTRIRVFWLLCHSEECVINISAMMEMSSPAISHHLKMLKESGLVVMRRVGKEAYYRVADTREARLLHQIIESVMKIACPAISYGHTHKRSLSATVRELHDYILDNLDKRLTIEELSHRFLINPTTLKATFKEMYGSSVAAHIKAHRMEKAAELLRETEMSISEIAYSVGYESQSKFSEAFKTFYHILPRDYRLNKIL